MVCAWPLSIRDADYPLAMPACYAFAFSRIVDDAVVQVAGFRGACVQPDVGDVWEAAARPELTVLISRAGDALPPRHLSSGYQSFRGVQLRRGMVAVVYVGGV